MEDTVNCTSAGKTIKRNLPRNLSSEMEGVCGRTKEKVNLGKRGEPVTHQQVRGQGCQRGPQDADVTQREGGGIQAELNLVMASQC